MKLSPELAQSIVDRTKSIVSYVINIMDSDAVIIASSNPERIGEFHHGAKKVLESGDFYIIGESEAAQYPNVIPGISLPIRFQNEIIGVIGIGNGSDSAIKYGSLLQFTAELLLEQAFFKDESIAKEHAYDEFMQRLLKESFVENEEYFLHQAKLHQLNVENPYYIVVVHLDKNILPIVEGDTYNSDVFRYERSMEKLQETFSYRLSIPGLHTVFMPSHLVFMVPLTQKDMEDTTAFTSKFLANLDFILSQTLSVTYCIGYDNVSSSMRDIHATYNHALFAIHLSMYLGKNRHSVAFPDVYNEYLLLKIPKDMWKSYYEEIIGNLLTEKSSSREQLLSTLEAFFNNDKSLVKTSEQLFIHRNSLLFRLNRIYTLTGFHPQNFKDAMKLYNAYVLWKLDMLSPSKQDILFNLK